MLWWTTFLSASQLDNNAVLLPSDVTTDIAAITPTMAGFACSKEVTVVATAALVTTIGS